MKLKSFLVWGIVLIAVVGIIYGLIYLAKTSPVSKENVQAGNGTIPQVTSSDWSEGNKNATTTLIEYGDFECPVCAEYAPALSELVKEFGDRMVFVYRYFPLETIHQNAALSAAAAEAAGMQGKFWEMHDLLFKNQDTWANQSASDAENTFIGFASEIGLDKNRFESDMTSGAVTSKIGNIYNDDLKMGLTYTPTFVLNGKIIQNPTSYDEFKNIIEQATSGR